ncbi:helix-turn-helix transcriptional regulator [Herbaspirillum huttiense]|uniref:helix-turn-helix transcriptional regulator n=1 Tax=Herbaspirillum huttiense TaxID=863372 RepID=UPI003B3A7762
MEAHASVEDDSLDIDDFISQLSKEDGVEEELAESRRWLAGAIEKDESALKKLRLNAGLSQKRLAELVGLRQPNISEIESGQRTPSVPTILRLKDVLGVSGDDLLKALVSLNPEQYE